MTLRAQLDSLEVQKTTAAKQNRVREAVQTQQQIDEIELELQRKMQELGRLTNAAADRVKHLMANRSEPANGLRIGIRTGGCSGMAYEMEFAQDKEPLDEVVEEKGVKLFVDSKALMFLIGTEMDYVEDKLQSGFVFNNPNEKGRCGCGESFHV